MYPPSQYRAYGPISKGLKHQRRAAPRPCHPRPVIFSRGKMPVGRYRRLVARRELGRDRRRTATFRSRQALAHPLRRLMLRRIDVIGRPEARPSHRPVAPASLPTQNAECRRSPLALERRQSPLVALTARPPLPAMTFCGRRWSAARESIASITPLIAPAEGRQNPVQHHRCAVPSIEAVEAAPG